MSLTVLILGGTTEASALARLLAGDRRFVATLSLAGRTKTPALLPIAMRSGGFGGPSGLAAHLIAQGVEALVDATHPFARRISFNAAAAADFARVPLLGLRRPAWHAVAGDRWFEVPDMAAAAAALGSEPRRVWLTIGQLELAPFRAQPQHDYLIRSVDAPDPSALPPRARCLSARGPFAEADELRLLCEEGIEVLVTKNSGGTATAAKLAAARTLGIAVIMVIRPPVPDVATVAEAGAAFDWLLARHEALRGV